MRFKFFEVGWDEEDTGAGNRFICTDTLADAKRQAREQVEHEASRNMDDNGRIARLDLSSVSIQEYAITGTPRQIAAAATVVMNTDSVEWSAGSKLLRGVIVFGRRWNLNYAGRLFETPIVG